MAETPPAIASTAPSAAQAQPRWWTRVWDFAKNFVSVAAIATVVATVIQWRTFENTISTDRASHFAEAIANLANTEPGVRVGALYSIDWIARADPKTYREPMLEILTVYILGLAPADADASALAATRATVGTPTAVLPTMAPTKKEIRTALTILLRAAQQLDDTSYRIDLSRTDLREGRFAGKTLTNFMFSGVEADEINFTGATLTDIVFSGADLAGAEYIDATLTDVEFIGQSTNLNGAWFSNATLDDVSFADADASDAHFFDATLKCVDFTNATLTGAHFPSVIATYVNLRGADLDGATISWDPASNPIVYYDDTTNWPESGPPENTPPSISPTTYIDQCGA
jgi:uncharacterized protein YjbI with pentapeptide repeats